MSQQASDADLRKMVLGFRVSDLQVLLGFAGRNKSGKKNELQKRALELIKLHSPPVELKIRELQKRRYQQAKACDAQEMYPLGTLNQPMTSGYGASSSHHSAMGPGSMGNNYQTPHSKPNINPHQSTNIVPHPQYAVNPDVKFKELPFFDILGELLRPSTLMPMHGERFQERDFIFHLTPHQAHEVSNDEDVKVQLRFCLLETSCDQEDNFPSSICVKVNKRMAPLPNPIPTNKPGVDPKRPSRPVDITLLCRLIPTVSNEIHISWASSYGRAYVIAVYLVRKQNSVVLINRLKANGVRNPDHTTAMIKEKLCQDRDSEIATMSLRGSLICPLGKIKMKLPCRALTCTHLQCFDATLYIQMNEKKPKWICPVCDKPALFKTLAIDGLFLDIATKAPEICTEVQFHENGSWTPVIPIKKDQEELGESIVGETPKKEIEEPKSKPKQSIEIVNLDSDSDTEDSWPITELMAPPAKKPCKPTASVAPVPTMSSILAQSMTVNSSKSGQAMDLSEKLYDPSTSSDKAPVGLVLPTSKRESLNLGSMEIRSISPVGVFLNSPKYPNDSDTMSPSLCASTNGTSFADQLDAMPVPQSVGTFDLYSLIQNQSDQISFIPVKEPIDSRNATSPPASKSPDIISIDDD